MSKLLPDLLARASAQRVETDVIAVYQDGSGKPVAPRGAYGRIVEKFRKGDSFKAKAGSVQHLRFGGRGQAENALLVGFGKGGEMTEEKARAAGGTVWSKLQAEKSRSAQIQIESLIEATGLRTGAAGADPLRIVRAFLEGVVLPAYRFNKYQSKSASAGKKQESEYFGPAKITLFSKSKELQSWLQKTIDEVTVMGECVNLCRDWSNEPSNFGTPEYYANEVRKLGRQYGLKVTVLSERECERQKMGLFLGVGAGSEREGKVVIAEYAPKASKGGPKPRTLALVGKGITFDSGGISIKPSMKMEEMKHDMTGAATVFAATLLAARWKVPNKIVCVMGFTENMPSGSATQPGNVLRGRNGKTVEVWNTDAEGRLILGDILDLAQDYKPDAVINAATLTGAVSVALGKYCCGILGNDDGLISRIRAAGDANGERIWQLPLFDDYFEDLKSELADMKNIANDPQGGTIRAAMFLKQFIRKGVKWAHLDIAATANGISHLSYIPKKGASGLYVRMLAQFAAEL